MTDLLVVAAIWFVGWLLVAGGPDVGSARIAWRLGAALPLGAAGVVTAELVLLTTSWPIASPPVALAVAALSAIGVAARRGGLSAVTESIRSARVALGVAAAALVLVTAVTVSVPLTNVTPDSFRYLTIARLLAVDAGASSIEAALLQSRGIGVAVLHGLGTIEIGYVRPLAPMLALSAAVMLWALVRAGTSSLGPETASWLAGVSTLAMVANHRYAYNALYLNGHMMVLVWVLVMVGTGLWVMRDTVAATSRTLVTIGLVTTGVVCTRPEGVFVVGLLVLPLLVAREVPSQWRRWVLGLLGIATAVWHLGVLFRSALGVADGPGVSIWGTGMLGLVLVLTAVLPPWWDGRLGRRPLVVTHSLAWVGLAALTVSDPSVLVESIEATLQNVAGAGRYGLSLVLVAVLLLAVAVVRHVQGEQILLFPLFTYVPLVLVLAYLREGAYRVGPGDSLNRMLLHLFPLLVLGLALASVGKPRARPVWLPPAVWRAVHGLLAPLTAPERAR